MPTSTTSANSVLSNAWKYFNEYFFYSSERANAWLNLLTAIALTIAYSYIGAAFGRWLPSFWSVIELKNLSVFTSVMLDFLSIMTASVLCDVAKNFVVDSLYVNWREWKTQQILDMFLNANPENNNYLDILRKHPEITSPEQRIQEDLKSASYYSISLIIGFIAAFFNFSIFVGLLWQLSGPLAITVFGTSLSIPGYLVFIAIGFSGLATLVTHTIGKALAKINTEQQTMEASFRGEIKNIAAQSESVGLEQGEVYFLNSLKNKILSVVQNTREKIRTRRNLVAFQSFYNGIAYIFPYLCATPMFFMGFISFPALMQIGFAFREVNNALNWFIDSYETLAIYRANLSRILELQEAIQNNAEADHKNIQRHLIEDKDIEICNLNVLPPETDSDYIFKNLNLKLLKGESTLINGASGLGKSTLFKAISGSWTYGQGHINLPQDQKLSFLAQCPTLVNASLADELAYPYTRDYYTYENYNDVLSKVGGLDKFIGDLQTPREWTKILSGGQKQRISFARALLQKPDWLFLDETTASLDPQSESELYTLLTRELKNTTFVSIAHRESVQAYHQRVITFNALNPEGEIMYSNRYNFFASRSQCEPMETIENSHSILFGNE